jgi:hypothetical protein
MKKSFALFILAVICFSGCLVDKSKTEKIQKKRDKIVSVKNDIVDIKTEVLFGKSLLYIIDDYLVLLEVASKTPKCIHLFDKNTFRHIASTGLLGRGPGEITEPGNIGVDRQNKMLWVPDFGQKVIWKFPLDSVLKNEAFMPTEYLRISDDVFIDRFNILNDSIFIGKAVRYLDDNSYITIMSKLNIRNNVVQEFGYANPRIEDDKAISLFALSIADNIYVNSYFKYDLITICNLEGKLLYNVYGPEGLNNDGNKKSYYFGIEIADGKIFASYINDLAVVNDGNRPKGNSPSKLLIFNTRGDYLFTIETGDKFSYFCVDEDNNRIIAYFDGREEALGYFNIPVNY